MKDTLQQSNNNSIPEYSYLLIDVNGANSWEVCKPTFIISDEDSADVLINSAKLKIEIKEKIVLVSDMGSESGTYINGTRLVPSCRTILNENDLIKTGNYLFRIQQIEKEMEKETEKEVEKEVEKTLEDGDLPPDLPQEMAEVISKTNRDDDQKYNKNDNKNSNNDNKKNNNKTKNKKLAHPIIRIFAFATDLLLTFALYKHFSLHPYIVEKFEKIFLTTIKILKTHNINYYEYLSFLGNLNFLPSTVSIANYFEKFSSVLVSNVLLFTLIFIINYLLFHSISGVSLGSSLWGIAGGEGFLWNRIGGFSRALMSLFTIPLLIGELPLIFRRRSFKEWLTMTTLVQRGILSIIIAIILFLPLYLAEGILWPFYLHRELISGVSINEIKIDANNKIDNKIDLGSTLNLDLKTSANIRSNHFRLSSKGNLYDLKSSAIFFVPSFEIIKKDNNKTIFPIMEFYDLKNKNNVVITAFNKSPLYSIIERSSKKIFYFYRDYPRLNNYLEIEQRLGSDSDSDSEFADNNLDANSNSNTLLMNRNSEVLQGNELQEVIKLLTRSFTLNISQLPEYIKELNPYLYGYAFLREKLIYTILSKDSDYKIKVQWVNFDGGKFLMLFREGENSQSGTTVFILPVNYLDGLLYEIKIYGGDKESTNETLNRILSFMKNNFYWGKAEGSTSSESSASLVNPLVNPFIVIDKFVLRSTSAELAERVVAESFVIQILSQISNWAINQKDEKIQNQILKTIRRYEEVVKLNLRSNQSNQSNQSSEGTSSGSGSGSPEFVTNTYKFLADLKKIELSLKDQNEKI
ncbi:MAG: FHA domain-containing protein [Oligoflexia bacterium]|nr:FHA domain-containing protein [Oligoflexia bacterium]